MALFSQARSRRCRFATQPPPPPSGDVTIERDGLPRGVRRRAAAPGAVAHRAAGPPGVSGVTDVTLAQHIGVTRARVTPIREIPVTSVTQHLLVGYENTKTFERTATPCMISLKATI